MTESYVNVVYRPALSRRVLRLIKWEKMKPMQLPN